ncbi:hypothetical protein SEA_STELLA_81 [Streptomyces phage Stella]|nr:hypothetical protein SEA_STELLA_81 [Streptomyces phage Stella]
MCGMNETCPVHGRNDVRDAVENNTPARAVTYLGEYAVATLDNPEYQSPMTAINALMGRETPNMFMHLVVKVGPEGCLGDVLDAGGLKAATVFRETFVSASDSRLDPFIQELEAGQSDAFNAKLTEIMHDAHDMVVSSVKDGTIA